jgi:hypothetical protein
MARKKSAPEATIKAEATAKAELSATYQRKRTTTEVIPPDVTRAKASAWLTLISPITEWAGLKGDALRFKRHQLRIQQEAALEELAAAIDGKMRGQEVSQRLPAKILVPALEAASLEQPGSMLIDWWANLLVAAVVKEAMRPYLVELMRQLGPEEAALLETIWSRIHKNLVEVGLNIFTIKAVRMQVTSTIQRSLNKIYAPHYLSTPGKRNEDSVEFQNKIGSEVNSIICWADEIGVPCEISAPIFLEKGTAHISQPSSFLHKSGASIDVCKALNILRDYTHFEPVPGLIGFEAKYEVRMLEFTELGLEFMNACRGSALQSKAASQN